MGNLSETDLKMLEKAANEFMKGDNWKKPIPPKMRRPRGQDYPSLKGKGYLEIREGPYEEEYFWIMPVKLLNAEPNGDLRKIQFFPKGQISIDVDYIICFLRVFVEKYLNKDLYFKVWGNHFEFEGFEWFGENIYSYSDMKKMLKEITETAKLLEKDYDNPILDQFKKDYNYHYLIYSHIPGLTEEGENNVIKKNIDVLTDFYRRFVKRIELMMKQYLDCTHIAFEDSLEGAIRVRDEEYIRKSKHP